MTLARWLRPLIKGILRIAFRLYYRSTQVQGTERFPAKGPVLLVANHPSSLLDPAALVYVLSRPVHFGAKHTLFKGPFRAVLEAFGAIPLVRAQDDQRAMGRNLEAFERYAALLGEGRVTAIFAEGLTQDDPHLSRIKQEFPFWAPGSEPLYTDAASERPHFFIPRCSAPIPVSWGRTRRETDWSPCCEGISQTPLHTCAVSSP